MTSKERLERIENFIWGSPITKEYRESLNADVKEIKKDLDRLETIDNANPSEALKSLEYICKILNEKRIDVKWLFKNDYNTIKNALLKAQEQEKAIKILKDYIEYEELGETQAGYMFRAYFNDTLNYEEIKTLKEVLDNGKD